MAQRYVYDIKSYSFRKTRVNIRSVLGVMLKLLLVSLTVTILVYTALALLFNTDVDRRLSRENRMYEKTFSSLQEKDALVKSAIAGLEDRDDRIYDFIFHTDSPSVDPINSLGFLFGSDTIPDRKIVSYTRDKADALTEKAAAVEQDFLKIYDALAAGNTIPPMSLPLANVSFPQIGASTGEKMSPFLKTYSTHNGIDFIASLEDPVFASAPGVVLRVERSRKGQGNVVEIEHNGGYATRYAHLSAILVSRGQRVALGQKIGTVGMTGNSFVPHLHYEVLRGGYPVDPINFIFASVNPQDYANMLFMAVNTDKSMD